jgi:hypothetical protein
MKTLAIMLVSAALVAIAGCIEYEEDLRLNANGSGVVYVRYAIAKFMALSMAGQQGTGQSGNLPVTEDSVRAQFAGKPGLTLSGVKSWDEEEKRVVRFTVAFDKLHSLQKSGFGSFEGGFKFIRNADDTYVYERKMDTESSEGEDSGRTGEAEQKPEMEAQPETKQEPGTGEEPETGQGFKTEQELGTEQEPEAKQNPEMEPEPETKPVPDEAMDKMGDAVAKGMMEGMSQAMGGMMKQLPKFTFKLRLPKNIVETNANYHSGNYAEWKMEFSAEAMQTSNPMAGQVFTVKTSNVDPSSPLVPVVIAAAAGLAVIVLVVIILRGRKSGSTAGQFPQ